MNLMTRLGTPGEHAFAVSGKAGQLEAVLSVPEDMNSKYFAIIGHPHTLQGGTMNNKVVTTLVRAFRELGIPCIRFNFRGAGQSDGEYDAGIGESEDMLMLAHQVMQEMPDIEILFAGFSFGSYVAWRSAAQCKHGLLITVAPPVHHYDYTEFASVPAPWIVVQGDQDEVVPMTLVEDFVKQHPALDLLTFEDTGHFFHGKLVPLRERLVEAIRRHGID